MSGSGGPGLFITLEGGEGVGKSTQAPRICRWLEARGHQVVSTRQPGGTPLAEQLRALVLDPEHPPLAPLTELLLLFSGRAQFLHEVVRPALAAGHTVLCDRFTDSTYAYQGGGRGMPLAHIAALEELVHGDLQPNLTLLFELPVAEGLARVARRGGSDRFEQEAVDFFMRVQAAYAARAAARPGRFRRIDASGDPDQVFARIAGVLESELGG